MNKAFFLDRDGTINVDYGYVHDINRWQFCSGAIEALKLIKAHGYLSIVVTNQSGIGRGMYTIHDMQLLHEQVNAMLAVEGASIDAFYYCPHLPSDDCCCRKPRLGMYRKAIADFSIDPILSVAIGDKLFDIERVGKLGVTRTSLIGNKFLSVLVLNSTCFETLLEATQHWLKK